jgi:hypothetical protein
MLREEMYTPRTAPSAAATPPSGLMLGLAGIAMARCGTGRRNASPSVLGGVPGASPGTGVLPRSSPQALVRPGDEFDDRQIPRLT